LLCDVVRQISRVRVASYLILSVLLTLHIPACATVPAYQASGHLADQQVSTTVDSEISQYYLEHYLQNDHDRPEYDEKIDKALAVWNRAPLDRNTLKEISEQFSPDFATLYFVSRISQDPVNRWAQGAFRSHVATLRIRGEEEMSRVAKRFQSYLIAFVPGYGYKEDPATGADFGRQRRIMDRAGFRNVLIETEEIGTVEKNASILATEIARLGKRYNNIILVSTSKGGPEVALAIGQLMTPDQLRAVKAWISIGGLLRGSPEADQALTWPTSWLARIAFFFHGIPIETVKSLHTEKRREVFAQLDFPQQILLLQYVGVPLSGQIAEHVQGRYKGLRKLGPNDGLTLLADELIEGGIVITDIGLDHFYADPEIDVKTFALAQVAMDALDNRERGRSPARRNDGRGQGDSRGKHGAGGNDAFVSVCCTRGGR
jgi:hypothetical protein